MRMTTLMNSSLLPAAIAVLALAPGASAQQARKSLIAPDRTISVCYRTSDGKLRATTDGTCGRGEQLATLPVTPLVGPQGPQGASGPVGPMGPTGMTGDRGATGPAGMQGPIGAPGAQGLQGPIGDLGLQGLEGDAGAKGPQGPTGAQGVKGIAGTIQGPQGADGPPGSVGSDGQANHNGINGYQQLTFTLRMGGSERSEAWVACNEGRTPFGVGALSWDTRVLGEKVQAFLDPAGSRLVKVKWTNWDAYAKSIQVTLACAWVD